MDVWNETSPASKFVEPVSRFYTREHARAYRPSRRNQARLTADAVSVPPNFLLRMLRGPAAVREQCGRPQCAICRQKFGGYKDILGEEVVASVIATLQRLS